MFNPLKGLSDLRGLQQQAQKMQEVLSKEEIITENGGVRVIMSGNMHVKHVTIDEVPNDRVADAVNEAVQKAQKLAASKLFEMSQE